VNELQTEHGVEYTYHVKNYGYRSNTSITVQIHIHPDWREPEPVNVFYMLCGCSVTLITLIIQTLGPPTLMNVIGVTLYDCVRKRAIS
jgi:hypothetical protein